MKIDNKDTKERTYLFDGQSKVDPDDYIHDDLNVLVIYGDNSSFTKTVEEHLHSFKQYLPFNVYYANGVLDYNNISWLDDFDVIIIHYSLGLYHQNYASTNVLRDLKKSKAVKFVFAQDEYDNTNELIRKINFIEADTYFTCVPEDLHERVFGGRLNPNIELINNLTGYVPNYQKYARLKTKKLGKRKFSVSYRGRPLHPKYGLYGYLKWNAGKRFKEYCEKNSISFDIEVSEEARLYWDTWHGLLLESRGMLATPSGSNVFDFDGSIREQIDQRYGDSKFDHYPKILNELKPIEEEFFDMGQISPKMFEMMAFGVVPLVVAAQLIPEMKSGQNYIEVSPQLDNLEEVFNKLGDDDLCHDILQKNYSIIDSEKYSYRTFIFNLERLIRRKVRASKGIEFLTTAYAKKKKKINWEVNDSKRTVEQSIVGSRNFESINYSIMPRDSFTSSPQYYWDIWSYQEYLTLNRPRTLFGRIFFVLGKPLRFLRHVINNEAHIFKNNNLRDLTEDRHFHRRILAKVFLITPKRAKETLYKFFG